MTTTTFFANAGDAGVRHQGVVYATVQAAATGTTVSSDIALSNSLFAAVYYICRYFLPFDTSAIPDTATISAANVGLYARNDFDNTDTDSVSIVQTSAADPVAITTADFDAIGTTKGATDKTYASISQSAYNVFALNATGLGWVSKTSYTLIGVRAAKDISATAPSANTYMSFGFSEESGTSTDPYVEVTYATGYTLALDQGSYALTGQDIGVRASRKITLEQGSYALSGQDTIVARGYKLALEFGSYILTGIDVAFNFRGWLNQTKNSSTFANQSKNASTFSNESKSSSSWTDQNKS